jgi:hypothetical protein
MADFLFAMDLHMGNKAVGAADKLSPDHILIAHKNAPFCGYDNAKGG